MVVVDLLQHLHELLHRVVLQLALAQVSLLDEELDVGLLLLLRDALVGILSDGRLGRGEGTLIEFRCGDDTISHLYLGHLHLLRADAGIEGQEHLGLVVVGIGEVGLHRVIATHLVADGLVVAQHALTLERGSVTLDDGTVRIAQFRNDRHNGLLLHVLLREVAINGCGDSASLSLKRIRGHSEIVCREGSQFRTGSEKHHGCY